MKKVLSIFILLCFSVTSAVGNYTAYAEDISLPAPGMMVNLSPAYEPVLIKGLKVHPDNPFLFDFIIDTGNTPLSSTNVLIVDPVQGERLDHLADESHKLNVKIHQRFVFAESTFE